MSAPAKIFARPKGNGAVLTAHAPPLADRVLSAPFSKVERHELHELRQEVADLRAEFRAMRQDFEFRFNLLIAPSAPMPKPTRPQASSQHILGAITHYFHLSMETLTSKDRAEEVVWARHLGALLLRDAQYTFREIQHLLGWDSTLSPYYAIRSASDKISRPKRFRTDYENLRKILDLKASGEDPVGVAVEPSTKGKHGVGFPISLNNGAAPVVERLGRA